MSNFSFLQTGFPELFAEASEAEKYTLTAPKYAAILCRSALERAVSWLYENDNDFTLPHDTKLSALMYDQGFRSIMTQRMFQEINVVRLCGNNAAHGKNVSQSQPPVLT